MAEASRIAAFFDLDKTVLTHSSGNLWARYMHREGRMGWRQLARMLWWNMQYRLAVVDMVEVTRRLVADMQGQSEADLIEESHRWFQEMVKPRIAARARERIDAHLAQGHVVALLTASTPYVSAPVAGELGLGESFICTRLEVADGVFTGRCVEPPCYGPGKVYWAQAFAAERGLDLATSHFYTDSYTDLAMLEAVGHPVAVNPDARLRRLARRRGWPVECFY